MCPLMSTKLPRPKEARRAEKGRTRGPDPNSLAIVSGVVRTVIRRVTVERRLLGSREQPGRRQCQARKVKMKAAKAVKELLPFKKWLDTDEEPMCPLRVRNRSCANGNPARAEDVVPCGRR